MNGRGGGDKHSLSERLREGGHGRLRYKKSGKAYTTRINLTEFRHDLAEYDQILQKSQNTKRMNGSQTKRGYTLRQISES